MEEKENEEIQVDEAFGELLANFVQKKMLVICQVNKQKIF